MPPPSAMAVQQQLRRLVINRAVNTTHGYSSYYPISSNSSTRNFHTTPTLLTRRDPSTIDFAYMPELEPGSNPPQYDILRVPILPDNSTTPLRANEAPDSSVIKPEIATVSANGTHIDSPSAMFEVVDNHAVELSPFDLTHKVTTAATGAAVRVQEMAGMGKGERSPIGEFWEGFVNDIFGPKGHVGKL